jgi:hypothetical protein
MTGTLVPPHDAVALTKAITRYINDPQLRQKHGVRARERVVNDFRAEPIWEFIFEEYERLLSLRGCGPCIVPGGAGRSASDCRASIGAGASATGTHV